MTARYYICPYVTLYALGGGMFSLTDPGGARQTNGARLLIYGVWQRDITGHSFQTIIPTGGRGRAKDTCINYVEAPDVDPLNLHTLIQADTNIVQAPWTPDNLTGLFSSLTTQQQSDVRAYLAATFFDDQWITATRTFGDILSYITHILFAAQQLGANYPDGSLTARWNSLSTARQTDINAYLTAFNLPIMTGNPTIRETINRLAQADYGANNPFLGPTIFPAWTP